MYDFQTHICPKCFDDHSESVSCNERRLTQERDEARKLAKRLIHLHGSIIDVGTIEHEYPWITK